MFLYKLEMIFFFGILAIRHDSSFQILDPDRTMSPPAPPSIMSLEQSEQEPHHRQDQKKDREEIKEVRSTIHYSLEDLIKTC